MDCHAFTAWIMGTGDGSILRDGNHARLPEYGRKRWHDCNFVASGGQVFNNLLIQ